MLIHLMAGLGDGVGGASAGLWLITVVCVRACVRVVRADQITARK